MIETLTFDDIFLMGEGTYQAYRKEIKKYGPYLGVILLGIGAYAVYQYFKEDGYWKNHPYFNQSGSIAQSHTFNPQGLPADLKFNEKEVHCDLLHQDMVSNSHRLNFAQSKAEHNQLKREIDLMKKSKFKENCKN